MKTVKELKKASRSEIFHYVAKKFGSGDIRNNVYEYLRNHSSYGNKIAYRVAYVSTPRYIDRVSVIDLPIGRLVNEARYQRGVIGTGYGKILVEGNTNIYWASPIYLHSDYNKSVAMVKNESNIKLMYLINSYVNSGRFIGELAK